MGQNIYGELGDGTTNSRSLPVSVASNVVAVAAGERYSLFLKCDGTLWVMGQNNYGQLGNGTMTQQNSPECVASNVVAMAAGSGHSLFLKSDCTLWAMGDNSDGQLGDGTMIQRNSPECVASNVVAVAAGALHSLYLKSDGTLWAMGDNSYGELGDGTMTSTNLPVCVPGMSLATVRSGCNAFHTLAVGTLLPPVITSQPTNQIVMAGSPVTFTATASGFAPLSYQWQFNGTNVLSATNTSYEIASAALSDTGDYAVIVTNNYGSTVSLTATLTVTNQSPPTATVTVTAAPINAGSVSGGGVYIVGSNAVLMAAASNNWQFINWNDGATNNPYVITVPATNITFSAQFAATATITVLANPNSGGSVTGNGTFLVGSTNLISAVASNGWIFAGWSDTTSINPYSITVTSNLTLTANFVPAVTVTTVALPPEGGLTTGDGTYAIGGSATVTATATNGWAFLSWNGAVTNNPWTFLVSSNATVCTATFAQVSTVTGLANPTNAGSVAGGGVYIVGSNAVLTATASNNWKFINWNDGATNNPYVITVPDTNVTYTANFAATATITVAANPNTGGHVTGGGTFLVGSTNPITAVASNGWIFAGWSDTTAINPYSITVTSNLTLTANFVPAATVTIIINPTNAGVVMTGGGVYAIGSNAVLRVSIPTSTNQNQWIFLNWNGTVTNYTKTGNTNNPLEFTVTSDITVTANFAQVTSNGLVYTYISVEAQSMMIPGIEIIGYDGDATSLVIPAQIDGVPVNEIGPEALTGEKFDVVEVDIDDGISSYTLDGTCVGAEDLEFAGDMEALDGLIAAGELIVAADAVVDCSEVEFAAGATGAVIGFFAGIFSDLSIVQVTANPDSGGHGTGSGLYFDGSSVEITATADDGWRFTHWDDGNTNRDRWVPAPGEYTANFVQQSTVTVLAAPTDEAGTVRGGGTYDVGTHVYAYRNRQ